MDGIKVVPRVNRPFEKKDDFFYGEGDANESRRSTTMRGIRIALNKKRKRERRG
ncbi:hypothetical protein HNQ43_001308 [Faecalicoccus acidiformans]|uniref:Uncharacterized protein n=1 Tax=Faecalicoccus acidiformans TaxID=915173 RepID=A0A7W8D485_9FIRM|nr:hypothetical protein [Faecalicoccus acidiformans]MBB5185255.1 hypothetical protein [Faecalicoccus acidiformans]